MRPDMNKDIKPYTLSILVQDIPGVLSQVARLFSRKGYNIESIVSGESGDPGVTRITIVLLGDELMISQIAAQCRKLLPVIAVKILDESTSLQREMALIKVKTWTATPGTRSSRWPTSSGPTSSTSAGRLLP